jgi:hypothetical protein
MKINLNEPLVTKWQPVINKCPEIPPERHEAFAKALEATYQQYESERNLVEFTRNALMKLREVFSAPKMDMAVTCTLCATEIGLTPLYTVNSRSNTHAICEKCVEKMLPHVEGLQKVLLGKVNPYFAAVVNACDDYRLNFSKGITERPDPTKS